SGVCSRLGIQRMRMRFWSPIHERTWFWMNQAKRGITSISSEMLRISMAMRRSAGRARTSSMMPPSRDLKYWNMVFSPSDQRKGDGRWGNPERASPDRGHDDLDALARVVRQGYRPPLEGSGEKSAP